MEKITITITIPAGATVEIASDEQALPSPNRAAIAEFFNHYLSDNGRLLYSAAARHEVEDEDAYSFHDIATEAGIAYETAKSYHRNAGRSAKRWEEDTHDSPPIRLVEKGYRWDAAHQGMRATYRLPDGVAEIIGEL